MTVNDPKTRSIRSFVRRSGRITPSQRHALDNYWPMYGIEFVHAVPELPTGFEALKLEIGIGSRHTDQRIAIADTDFQLERLESRG